MNLSKFGFAFVAMVAGSPAMASECSFHQQILRTYLEQCPSRDGCANRSTMESHVARNCGMTTGNGQTNATASTQVEAPISRAKSSDRSPGALNQKDDALSADETKAIQIGLTVAGYKIGAPDGVVGAKTRQAIADFQRSQKMPVDGEPSRPLLAALNRYVAEMDEGDEETHEVVCEALREISATIPEVLRRSTEKADIYRDVKTDLLKLERDLSSDQFWVASEWRKNTSYALQVISLTANITNNALAMTPPGATGRRIIDGGQALRKIYKVSRARVAYKSIGRGWQLTNYIKNLTEEEYAKLGRDIMIDVLSETTKKSPIGGVATGTARLAADLYEDVKTLAEIGPKHESLKQEIVSQLASINSNIASIDRKMASALLTSQVAQSSFAELEKICFPQAVGTPLL